MSCKKPEDKERKAPSNRATIYNVIMQHLMFAVFLETCLDIVTFVEKMCKAIFYIIRATVGNFLKLEQFLSNVLQEFKANFKEFSSRICLGLTMTQLTCGYFMPIT